MQFETDRPIPGRESDRLGRGDFAEAVASAVRGWKGQDSLVIALYGPWGSGKSSIKNMVIEALKEAEKGPVVAEFNPWQFASRAHLSEAFFDQIGLAIGKGTAGSNRGRKRLLGRWRRYAAYLRAGGELFVSVKTLLVVILVVLTVFFGFAFLWPTLALVFGVLGLFGAVLVNSSRVAKAVSDLFAVGVEVGRKTLEEVKKEMADALRALPSPVLVVLDDVDRLTPAEAVELFQLVKANADLPNLVYLTLSQKEILAKNVEAVLKVNGNEYLEKIVQVGFNVPLVEQSRLNKVLFEGLDRLLADESVGKRFDHRRWGNLFFGGLQHYFKTLRDVHRYTSTLAFHIAVFRGKGVFEVNPIDLIALEALRVFEPLVYRMIPPNKDLLTGRVGSDSGDKDTKRPIIHGIVDQAPEDRREDVREIIKQLFPPVEWAFGGSTYGATFMRGWERDLRVCSAEAFDRYFHFTIPEGDISQIEIESILKAAGSRDHLRKVFDGLDARQLLGVALDRLRAYAQDIPLEYSISSITAIFDIGEMLPRENPGFFDASAAMHAAWVVTPLLKKESDMSVRESSLYRAVAETQGISLPVRYVSMLDLTNKKKDHDPKESVVSDECCNRLKALCVEKIQVAAANRTLDRTPDLHAVLWRWKNWGNPQEPNAYCNQLTETPEGSLLLARAFLSVSHSQTIGDYVGKEIRQIRLGNIETFVDWELMEKNLQALDPKKSSQEDKHAIDAFAKAVKRRREGKPDLGDFDREDNED